MQPATTRWPQYNIISGTASVWSPSGPVWRVEMTTESGARYMLSTHPSPEKAAAEVSRRLLADDAIKSA